MEQPQNDRFVDPGETIYSLMISIVLVECPRCQNCATHKPIDSIPGKLDLFAPRRLVCPHCGYVRDWCETVLEQNWRESPARDDYFNEILWIRGTFGANEIWAYNWRHLHLIESFIAAKHRQHVRDPERGWANKSFVNRLPRWITSAKNRTDVLKTIERIKRERPSNT